MAKKKSIERKEALRGEEAIPRPSAKRAKVPSAGLRTDAGRPRPQEGEPAARAARSEVPPSSESSTLSALSTAEGTRRADRLERFVAGFGTAVVVGLALVGTGSSTAGAFLTLAGLVGLGASTHAFGRLGPDEAFDPVGPRAER